MKEQERVRRVANKTIFISILIFGIAAADLFIFINGKNYFLHPSLDLFLMIGSFALFMVAVVAKIRIEESR